MGCAAARAGGKPQGCREAERLMGPGRTHYCGMCQAGPQLRGEDWYQGMYFVFVLFKTCKVCQTWVSRATHQAQGGV